MVRTPPSEQLIGPPAIMTPPSEAMLPPYTPRREPPPPLPKPPKEIQFTGLEFEEVFGVKLPTGWGASYLWDETDTAPIITVYAPGGVKLGLEDIGILPTGEWTYGEGFAAYEAKLRAERGEYLRRIPTIGYERGLTPEQRAEEEEARQYQAWLKLESVLSEVFITDAKVAEALALANEDPHAFIDAIVAIGRSDATEDLLLKMGLTEEDIDLLFEPVAELADVGLEQGEAWFGIPLWKKLVSITPVGMWAVKESRDVLLALVGKGGALIEKYVNIPWETAILDARARFQIGIGLGTDADRAFLKTHGEIVRKYGYPAAFFADEYHEAFAAYLKEVPDPLRTMISLTEWLNPAYWLPIGASFGVAAKFTTKVPVLGRVMKSMAGGVQAAERGIAYPIIKPIELGARYSAKGLERVGVKLGKSYSERLIKQSEHLLLEIPESERMLQGVLVDNWMRRSLGVAAKIPPVRVGIEKGLGWRILVKRQFQAVEDIVGRGAVVHAEITRMGINAKIKAWELRAIDMNPVRLFGFNKRAYSPKMVQRLLPEYKGLAEAGTLEHVFTHPEMYRMAEKQLQYVTRVHEINTDILNLLKKEGVAPEHITQDWWIHRVVTGKFNPEGELIALRGRPGVRGKAIGAKPSFEMHRKAPTMAEGIAWGVQYGRNPELAVTSYIEEAFKKIADERFLKYIEPFGILPSERMAQRFPELVERAALTQTELADAAKFGSVINRAIRGEKLPEQTLRAMERRFPELGKKLRSLIKDEPMKPIDEAAYLAEHGPKDSFGFPSPRVGEIGIGDFIQLKGELGKGLKAPRGFIVGEGTIGKKIPAWKVKQPDGSITLIPKDEAIVLGGKPKIEAIKGFEGDAVTKEFTISPPKLDKKVELDALRKEVKALTEARKAPYWQARTERALKMEQVRRPEIGEGYIMQPFAGGRIFKQEFIDSFNKFFGHEGGLGVLKVTSDIAGILRITKAALDFSAMAIQGLPSFGLAHSYLLFNPNTGIKLMGAWYKAFFNSTRAFFDAGVVAGFIRKNEAVATQRISMGGSSRVVDYFAALEAKTGVGGRAQWLMEKIPLKPYHRAETSFYAAGEMVRDEFWRILSPKAIARGQEFELARILDRITGIVDPKSLGVPLTVRQLEQTFVWFAPSYTRACLTVVADIFRGGMTGAMARKAIGGMITAGSIMYTGVQYALATIEGKSDKEAWEAVREGFSVFEDPITGEVEWKPSGRFMTIKIGNYIMGFGGFWYGLLRLAGNIMACVDEVGERERVDLIRLMKHGSLNKQDNPFIYWWYSRSSPLFGTGFELATGREFFGYPIETPAEYAEYIVKRFEPIWAEQGLNWMIPGLARDNEEPEGLARQALIPAELFGLRTFPESTWVNFYDKVNEYIKHIPEEDLDEKQLEAWREGKLEWKHLTEIQKATLLSRYPDLEELYGEAQADSAVRNTEHWAAWQGRIDEEREIYYTRVDELTQQLLRGEIDTREYREKVGEAGQNYGAILEAIERDPNYAEIYDFFDKKEAEGDKYGFRDDIVLAELQSLVLYAEDLIDSKGDYDWDERDRRVDAFIEKWGQETYDRIQQYLQEKKGLKGLSEVWIRKSADTEKLGRGYWRLPYKPIIEMDEDDEVEGNIPAEYFVLWQEYQVLETDVEREDFIKRNPEMAKDWRAEYRKANPEEDARLALWGYGGKLQSIEAYDLVKQWGKELGIPLEQMGLGLPPRSLIPNYFEHNKTVAETSGSSIESRYYLLTEGNKYFAWMLEQGIRKDDLSGESVDVLKLRIDFKENFTDYAAYGDWQSEHYIEDDTLRVETRHLMLFNAEGKLTDFGTAYYTKEAHDTGYSEAYWGNFVAFSGLPQWGDWRERYLADVTNKGFAAEYYGGEVGVAHRIPLPEDIGPLKRDEIYGAFSKDFKEWNDTAGMTARQVEDLHKRLFKREAFEIAYRQVEAYDKGFPEYLIDTYVDWYRTERKDYEDDWFLMENESFYRAMVNKGIIQDRADFRTVPTREVYALFLEYGEEEEGKARFIFRHENPELEEWLVDIKGYTPVGDRWKEAGEAGCPKCGRVLREFGDYMICTGAYCDYREAKEKKFKDLWLR